LLRDGTKTVIIGPPNAGKSSLLNRLVGHERAIVSAEPGTTRDFIEERIFVGRHCLRLIDTAGLNPAPGAIEKLGMEKSLERASEADLILLVIDVSVPLPVFSESITKLLAPSHTLVVANKSDLVASRSVPTVRFKDLKVTRVSALTGDGLEALKAAITQMADALQPTSDEEVIAINARHADALVRARTCLQSAMEKLETDGPVELLASDLRGTLSAFGDIVGKVENERMLDQLFASFCIGK